MRRCLIVDHSSVVRKVACQIVVSLDYGVTEAESAEEAIQLCKAVMPDVILLDWQMPGARALDVLASIRAIRSERRPYIIYVTTVHDTLDLGRALGGGADDYMMKPFDRTMIVEKFEEMAARAAA